MASCPVCNGQYNKDNNACPHCGFPDIHRTFYDDYDRQMWLDTVVLPYRERWQNQSILLSGEQDNLNEWQTRIINRVTDLARESDSLQRQSTNVQTDQLENEIKRNETLYQNAFQQEIAARRQREEAARREALERERRIRRTYRREMVASWLFTPMPWVVSSMTSSMYHDHILMILLIPIITLVVLNVIRVHMEIDSGRFSLNIMIVFAFIAGMGMAQNLRYEYIVRIYSYGTGIMVTILAILALCRTYRFLRRHE